jgi:hypothetical protein
MRTLSPIQGPDGDARVSDISGAGPDVGRPMVNAGLRTGDSVAARRNAFAITLR